MSTCKNCGSQLAQGDMFCQNCGAKNEPGYQYGDTNNGYSNPPKAPNKNTGIIIAIVALIVVIIAALIVFLVVNNNTKKETAELIAQNTTVTETTTAPTTQPVTEEEEEETTEKAPQVVNNYYYGNEKYSDYDYDYENGDWDYLFPSDTEVLTYDFLNSKTNTEIDYIRNEIYARHGYIFKKQKYRDYFNNKSWYYGTDSDMSVVEKRFNSIERRNIKILVEYQGL